jgi:hypothetical protein
MCDQASAKDDASLDFCGRDAEQRGRQTICAITPDPSEVAAMQVRLSWNMKHGHLHFPICCNLS